MSMDFLRAGLAAHLAIFRKSGANYPLLNVAEWQNEFRPPRHMEPTRSTPPPTPTAAPCWWANDADILSFTPVNGTITVSTVPEPPTIGAVLLGLGVLFRRPRRMLSAKS
jgi:hypothetical protein